MEFNAPKVSVLMPAYNSEKYISEAIESILNQTFKDFEFIIIDDCSTDKTWNIIQKYEKQDSRITAVKNEKNMGIPINRNKLVSMAKGKYVVWQDSDDISVVNRIERQYAFMEKNPDVGICGGWLQFFNEKGVLALQKYERSDDKLRKKIFRYSPVSQGVAMIRKTVFDRVGKYDEHIKQAEDLDMTFRIGQYYSFANVQAILLRYRRHEYSITSARTKENVRATLSVRHSAYKKYNYKPAFLDLYANLGVLLFAYLPLPIGMTEYLFRVYRKIF